MALKQYTIEVKGIVTVTADESTPLHKYSMPMKIDIFTQDEDEDSKVVEVIETSITDIHVIAGVKI